MLPTHRIFRVFVSSTFNDLRDERNALHELAFPRLRDLCARHGADFQAIDLRWGISEDASVEQATMPICLGEIARCQRVSPRPNFLLLLGQRYGWRPPPTQIASDLFSKLVSQLADADRDGDSARRLLAHFYRQDANAIPTVHCLVPRHGSLRDYGRWQPIEREIVALLGSAADQLHLDAKDRLSVGASATEQETFAGALSVPGAREHVHVFIRTIDGLPHDRRGRAFIDLDAQNRFETEAARRLEHLKNTVRRRFGHHVHDYRTRWTGRTISRPPTNFSREVYTALADVIERELSVLQQQDPLDQERQLHDRFGENWASPRLFTGRRQTLARIDRYLNADSTWPLTLHGVSGCGKSAAMARAIAIARERHPKAEIVSRFIGVTPESSDGRALLESVCRQVTKAYGDGGRPVPGDYLALLRDFPARLKLARPERPLLLFLDALDQLSDQNAARTLNWLPQQLPPHVRLVVSTLPDPAPPLPVLRGRYPEESFIELFGLKSREGRELLALWLKEDRRTLQSSQRDEIMRGFLRCPLPLWLKLAAAKARHWRSYDSIPRLASTVPLLIGQLFARLSRPDQHGPHLISHSLGLIRAAKNGLTENELLEVLSRDTDFFAAFLKHAKFQPPERRLPFVVWSRLFFDLEPYLTERHADGASLLAFFHRQFGEVVDRTFLRPVDLVKRHTSLAHYFARQPNQVTDDGRVVFNSRRVSELPYQLHQSGMWSPLARTLTDLAFIEAKCASGLTYDLIGDYDAALSSPRLPRRYRRLLDQFARFVRANANLLAARPELTFQQALNEPDATAPAQTARRRVRSGRQRRALLRWVNKPQTTSPCLSTYVGHRDIVNSCDVSRDGRFIVSASSDEELKMWDVATGRELRTLVGHRNSIETCAFSPDARRIVSGGRDGKLKLWDTLSGREVLPLSGHRDAIATCAFSSNGRYIASASYDDTLRIWDANNGKELRRLRGHKANVVACVFSPDSSRVVSGASDGGLKVWSVRSGREVAALAGHEKGVWSCAFAPNGRFLVSASEDGTLRRWDVTANRLLKTYEGHAGPVWTCAISSDSRRIVSGSKDKMIRLWDAHSGRELACLEGHGEAIWGIRFFPDGRRVVSASWDWTLKVWDVATAVTTAKRSHRRRIDEAQLRSERPQQDGPIISCACSPDGSLYAAGCSDGSVRLWDAGTGANRGSFPVHTDYVTTLGFSPDGKWLVAGAWNGSLKLFDVSARRESATLTAHADQMRGCSFSRNGSLALSCSAEKIQIWKVTPGGLTHRRTWRDRKASFQSCVLMPDGARFVVGSSNGEIGLWSVNGTRRSRLGQHTDLVFCSVSPDGRQMVTSSSDGTLKVWDLQLRRAIKTLIGHAGPVESCHFSPDGLRIVSSGWDRTVKVWPLHQATDPVTLSGHTDQLQDACFTADGRKILSAGMDGTFRLWDASTPTALGLLVRPSASVVTSTFSRDGGRLLSASHNRTLKVWRSDKWRQPVVLRGHEGDILTCAFSPTGRRIVSAASDNTLRVWDTATGSELATLTGHEGPVVTCCFSPDGRVMASGSRDGTVRVWDAHLMVPPLTLKGHQGWVQQVVFSGDSHRLASASQDHTVRLWDMGAFERSRTLSGHRAAVETAAFSIDGRRLVSGDADGKLKVWESHTGVTLLTLSRHTGAIRHCTFSPDGSQILSASNDSTLIIWNARTGKLRYTLSGHSGPVSTCAFSRDGRRALSASSDQFVRVWDTVSAALVAQFWAGAAVHSATWHPNGRIIAAGDVLGRVHILELHEGA
jgi:WD40 repeat protein